MYLAIGLGNPGKEFQNTRHNIGFEVIEELSKRFKASLSFKQRLKSIIGKIELESKEVLLAKPQTFMNRSGEGLNEITKKYKVPLNKIIVIHDDLDLDVGRIKIKTGGSSGGHNGLESIINLIGSKDFGRIKIGIGKPSKASQGAEYVLSKIPKSQKLELSNSITNAADAVETIILYGFPEAMNKFNSSK